MALTSRGPEFQPNDPKVHNYDLDTLSKQDLCTRITTSELNLLNEKVHKLCEYLQANSKRIKNELFKEIDVKQQIKINKQMEKFIGIAIQIGNLTLSGNHYILKVFRVLRISEQDWCN